MAAEKILKNLSRYNIGTFADIVYRQSVLRPDKVAYIYGKEQLTYAQFNAKINSLVHALQKLGIKKGEAIGLLSWNCLDYAIVYGAAMKGGYIISRFNPRLQADELDYLINYSEVKALFVGPELIAVSEVVRPKLPNVKNYISLENRARDMLFISDLLENQLTDEPDVKVEEDDGFFIIYTSGTTGVPRGAVYSHREAWDDARTYIINLSIQPEDKHIQVSPMFHIAGDTMVRSILYMGGCNIILKNFDPAATLQLIQGHKATHVSIVPTHLVAMLALPDVKKYDISSLKFIWYGGSPMPVEVLKKGLATFGPIFGQGYGQSESGPAICHLPKEDHKVVGQAEEKRLESVGQPDIGVQVRIVDDKGRDVDLGELGEIIVRSKHIMKEYWKKPKDTSNTIIDGWLHTGDIGKYDERGYVFLVDRKKDMIITGGENVFPREVEEILYRNPKIHEVAVIGIPDPYWVEKVHAVIALKKGVEATPQEIIDFSKKNMAGYKTPKSVEFMESLPKNAAGKIMKRDLREKYWANSERKI